VTLTLPREEIQPAWRAAVLAYRRTLRDTRENHPADFAPEIAVLAKQLATAISTHNVRTNESLRGEGPITVEHVENNKTVHKAVKAAASIWLPLRPRKTSRRWSVATPAMCASLKSLTRGGRTRRRARDAASQKDQADASRAAQALHSFGKVGLKKPKKSKPKK
jgi:hypothetical protein